MKMSAQPRIFSRVCDVRKHWNVITLVLWALNFLRTKYLIRPSLTPSIQITNVHSEWFSSQNCERRFWGFFLILCLTPNNIFLLWNFVNFWFNLSSRPNSVRIIKWTDLILICALLIYRWKSTKFVNIFKFLDVNKSTDGLPGFSDCNTQQ